MAPIPQGCPDILTQDELESTVAVVTVHDQGMRVAAINHSTAFRKVRISASEDAPDDVIGWHLVLPRFANQPYYRFGRYLESNKYVELDVYLPGTIVATKQFTLTPDHSNNCWRYHSNSETLATVNGVPIQNSTARTRKKPVQYPHVIYLDQSGPNHVDIHGLKLTIWLLKSATDVLGTTKNKTLVPMVSTVQDVSSQSEPWARVRYFVDSNANVSRKSYPIIERFTGERGTAKLFGRGANAASRRDTEFLRMTKPTVNQSIVRYLQTDDINGIPAIITSTHDGFVPFKTCLEDIQKEHPSLRCRMASAMLRQLFSALEYLHHNYILHQHVTGRSVLLRFAGKELDRILLVDYSHTSDIIPGQEVPRQRMVEDTEDAIRVIDGCCDLWNIRKGPSPGYRPEADMQAERDQAAEEVNKILRFLSEETKKDGNFIRSARGKEYTKLRSKKEQALWQAESEMMRNQDLVEMYPVTPGTIQEMKRKWRELQPAAEGNEEPFMLLTLGHQYLDSLIDEKHRRKLEKVPRDICAQLKEMEGECERPWRKFTVSKTFSFQIIFIETENRCSIDRHSLAIYLAHWIHVRPELKNAIMPLYDIYVQRTRLVKTYVFQAFCQALEAKAELPAPMKATFERLVAQGKEKELQIEENFPIWWHVPSRMFNITQLHRLAPPCILKDCIENDNVSCTNFAEVRGDPNLQGCFVPLELLPPFARALQVDVVEAPETESMMPMHDPCDFSQVAHDGRMILARRGLVGFASVCRTANQLTHCPRNQGEIHGVGEFLPTFFGDMNVLPPKVDANFDYPRPTHWSKFVPAGTSTRRILAPQKPSASQANQRATAFPDDRNLLQDTLDLYKDAFNAVPPPKRNLSGSFISGSFNTGIFGPSSPKRRKGNGSPDSAGSYSPPYPAHLVAPHLSNQQLGRLAALPPRPIDPNQSVTIVAGSFSGYTKDQRDVEEMLEAMSEESKQPSTVFDTARTHFGTTFGSSVTLSANTLPSSWVKAEVEVLDSVMEEPEEGLKDEAMTFPEEMKMEDDAGYDDDDADSVMADTVIMGWESFRQ
jgi:hypothetical protein